MLNLLEKNMNSKQAFVFDKVTEDLTDIQLLLDATPVTRIPVVSRQMSEIVQGLLLQIDREIDEVKAYRNLHGSSANIRKRLRNLYQRRARANSLL